MSTESEAAIAASIARSVSRWLKLGGYPMCKQENKWRWTEGFRVHRVGLSYNVSVHYHTPLHENEREHAMNKVAVEFLKRKGYTFDERGWIDARIPKVPR